MKYLCASAFMLKIYFVSRIIKVVLLVKYSYSEPVDSEDVVHSMMIVHYGDNVKINT